MFFFNRLDNAHQVGLYLISFTILFNIYYFQSNFQDGITGKLVYSILTNLNRKAFTQLSTIFVHLTLGYGVIAVRFVGN